MSGFGFLISDLFSLRAANCLSLVTFCQMAVFGHSFVDTQCFFVIVAAAFCGILPKFKNPAVNHF